ncbi:MAG: tetratricopeptide repeat protein [Thermodesulfobacteriota bacterium]
MEFTAQDYNRLGEERYNAGDIEGAKGAFEKAAAIDSKLSIALNNLGIISLHEHNLDDAFRYFLKANEFDPADLNILSNLVTCGSELGLWATIIGAVEHSLSFHPENADLLFILGSCYLRMDQKKRARELLGRCLQIQPEFDEAKRLLEQLKRE